MWAFGTTGCAMPLVSTGVAQPFMQFDSGEFAAHIHLWRAIRAHAKPPIHYTTPRHQKPKHHRPKRQKPAPGHHNRHHNNRHH